MCSSALAPASNRARNARQIASVSHSDRVGRGSRASVSKLKIDELRNATCSHKGDQYDRRRLSYATHVPGACFAQRQLAIERPAGQVDQEHQTCIKPDGGYRPQITCQGSLRQMRQRKLAHCLGVCSTGGSTPRPRSRQISLCTARYSPCSPPQITNPQAAPCHNPPSSIVIIRLR